MAITSGQQYRNLGSAGYRRILNSSISERTNCGQNADILRKMRATCLKHPRKGLARGFEAFGKGFLKRLAEGLP